MKSEQPKPAPRLSRQTIFLSAMALAGCAVVGCFLLWGDRGKNGHAEAAVSDLRLEDIPFDGAEAYDYLKQLCALGPRPSGSQGMQAQQRLLKAHFERFGARVEFQPFQVRHPEGEGVVSMANLIVRWHPEIPERIILCGHYDTLPFPLRDPDNPRGVFVGANDNGSGIAVLMALARDMPNVHMTRCGVDFVLFDGEEFIFNENQRYFLGSEYFARAYAKQPSPHCRCAVLLDMVGGANLQIYYERNSMWWGDTRPMVEQIWATAKRLGVREFIAQKKHEVRDDHLMLHEIAKIPACDIIDFDYPAWHTQADTPQQCSALSLAKVGWVLREWLRKKVTNDESQMTNHE